MTIISELRRRFEPSQIPAFGEDELYGEWREATFASRFLPPAPLGDLARMAAHPELRPFVEDIDRYLKKFSFGHVNLEQWNERYLFPRSGSVRAFCKRPENRSCDPDFVVNRTPQAVDEWVTQEIIPAVRDSSDKVQILVGGVGSGKSTFNKYVTTKFFNRFRDDAIVTSRVEYRKMYNSVSDEYGHPPEPSIADRVALQQLIQRYVYCCIVRDLFHYAWSDIRPLREPADAIRTFQPRERSFWRELDLEHDDAVAAFQHFVKVQYGTRHDINVEARITLSEVRRAIAVHKAADIRRRTRWFQELITNRERQAALEPFVQYASAQGVDLFVILDGLDYVQVSDFIAYTSHRGMLQAVAQWLIDQRKQVKLPVTGEYLYPSFQLTMRTNTYELFWMEYAQSLHGTESITHYVVPAAFRDIFRVLDRAPAWAAHDGSLQFDANELLTLFARLQSSLAKALGIRPRSISSLFLNNIRYRVHFARNVVEEILRAALESLDAQRQPRSQANLLSQVRKEATELLERKDYRLVDLLLHSKNDRFANFVRIGAEGIDLKRHAVDRGYLESALRDNNVRSGYIGNIFNYHIPYSRRDDAAFFLEKLRILDVIVRHGQEPVELRTLRAEFARCGWPVSPYVEFSLGILVRENMIAGFSISAGCSGYVATELGQVIRNNLVRNMTYLENVFFGCFLPSGVKRRACDIHRSTSQRYEWVAASIYHCWLLLRLVRTAEEVSGRPGDVRHPKGVKCEFFEDLRTSVAATVDRITAAKDADPKIASHALRLIDGFGEWTAY